jgi:predicted acylesterase/phospholipase RssA
VSIQVDTMQPQSPVAPNAAPGEHYRVLAFAGGGFDTAMQLGVAHALLVSDSKPPNCVVGVSAGAMNAAALIEILQAGDGLDGEDQKKAQVARFREFLERYPEVPRDLLASILPDAFEINQRAPLESLKLPIHFAEERKVRDAAIRARGGLARALNQFLKVDLPVTFFTILARRLLGLSEAMEEATFSRRWKLKARHLRGIYVLGWRYLRGLAPVCWGITFAWFGGQSSWKARQKKRETPYTNAGSAGGFIFKFKPIQKSLRLVRRFFGGITFALLWLIIPFAAALWKAFRSVHPSKRPLSETLQKVLGRVLSFYELDDGLANPDVLKQVLVKLIDPDYYGRTDIDEVLDKALARDNSALAGDATAARTVGDYAKKDAAKPGKNCIRLAVIAADIASGYLVVIPDRVKVVDALLAATAVVPVFPSVAIDAEFKPGTMSRKWLIDGVNVANDPIAPLMDYLREQDLSGYTGVDVYPVTPLPLSASTLPGTQTQYSGLVDVAMRSLALKQFRDGRLQHRTTRLYAHAMGGNEASEKVDGQTYIRAFVYPIEPGRELGVNRRLFTAENSEKRRDIIYETVAAGCRSALEAMLSGAIADEARGDRTPLIPCRKFLHQNRKTDGLPGNDPNGGPGLNEICARCTAMQQPDEARQVEIEIEEQIKISDESRIDQYKKIIEVLKTTTVTRQALVLHGRCWPEWPRSIGGLEPAYIEKRQEPPLAPRERQQWPRDIAAEDGSADGTTRPTVSLLFSGGVFRGVFYMGVANALLEVGCVPDLVAGASVGSITAAMVARLFLLPERERAARMADLVSTFLTIDRLVLTDRFADFVRLLTLRAADANVSPRDLDLVFRRYDFDGSRTFSARARRVTAGIERLSWISPFELYALIKAQRLQDSPQTSKLLRAYLQEYLVRCGVEQEILGSEPLSLLIRHLVLQQNNGAGLADNHFSAFLEKGIYFLATATNLTKGQLEILGDGRRGDPTLTDGLLASSAFPAIFRPRRSTEVYAAGSEDDQYIDGGVMDNLPFDAVTRFLEHAALENAVAGQPTHRGKRVPHLLFTASLETDFKTLDDSEAECVAANWLRLMGRANQLKYNRKVDLYAKLQRDLRAIDAWRSKKPGEKPDHWRPIDLHVLTVKPKWLCSTFAFHPMLGFRRRKQAANIAHGCASTFAALYASAANRENPGWMDGWGMAKAVMKVRSETVEPVLKPKKGEPGQCWFRTGELCPFSREKLTSNGVTDKTRLRELSRVYDLCGDPATHASPST